MAICVPKTREVVVINGQGSAPAAAEPARSHSARSPPRLDACAAAPISGASEP